MAVNPKKRKILEENLSHDLKWDSLIQHEHIGTGTFSVVYRYFSKDKEQKSYAVKIMKSDEESLPKILEEIKFLQILKEIPNSQSFIPMFYGWVKYSEKSDGIKTEIFALVFEIAEGTLGRLLKKRPQGITFEENLSLLKTIAFGLYNLQKRGIAHRDIKPENIIYFQEKDMVIFKIMDFGEMKINVENEGTVKGTPSYFSPETNFAFLNDEDHINVDYNPYKSDVYSFGITVLFANLKRVPFDKVENIGSIPGSMMNPHKNYRRIEEKKVNPLTNEKGPYDEKIKGFIKEMGEKFEKDQGVEQLKQLLEKALEYNPKNRCDWKDFKRLLKEIMKCREINEINDLKKVIEFKDKAIKILIERNSELMNLLDKEIKQKDMAEKTLNELLEEKLLINEEKHNEKEVIETVLEKLISLQEIIIKEEDEKKGKAFEEKKEIVQEMVLKEKEPNLKAFEKNKFMFEVYFFQIFAVF